ncbi:MAG TPA: bifunctional DNA-binding transcriptional regulator/O6-methylguanine-DNA methyltransferase Ada [Vicinamibacteria bacterium]|nr:bifunctional DNA-binding transcriptional regulator/O6-methylguanine-DNA methyltransferase Ada [Vicinamibacteria bacterium]
MIAVGRVEDDDRWTSVLTRDRGRDGAFVFAVATTGIYCRPSCPARRPRRENVRFFARPDDAEAAGFRACRRCRPRAARDPRSAWIERVCRRIEERKGERVRLAELSAAAGVSPYHLQRTFKRALGVSPRQYAETLRAASLKAQLKGGRPVTEATYEAGYGSPSRVYEKAHAQMGMTPGAYGRGGKGMRIAYGIARCSLGRVLVAATERGISAVYLGDDDAALEAALHEEYPAAETRRYDPALGPWLGSVLKIVDGGRAKPDLPLDVQATAFQWRVWQALREIPRGQTRTYGEIARAIGEPTASRAVARACATNRVSIVIPCHRVIASDGSLAGYRWGVERKKRLLEREGARP